MFRGNFRQAKEMAIIECAEARHLEREKAALELFRSKAKKNLDACTNEMQLRGRELRTLDQLRQTYRLKFKDRASMALFGGLVVIAPMLIMSLHPTKLTNLLTTSTFVVAVSLVLALVMENAEGKDIITATAAYAAILVVFVGAVTTSTG
jgi:hypothetical protein